MQSSLNSSDHGAGAAAERRAVRTNAKAARLLGVDRAPNGGLDLLSPPGGAERNHSGGSATSAPLPPRAGGGSGSSSSSGAGAPRRVSFKGSDKASRLLGMDSTIAVGGVGLPSTSETSECSNQSGGSGVGQTAPSAVRRARFAGGGDGGTLSSSFGSDGDGTTIGASVASSVVTFDRSVFADSVSSGGSAAVKKKKRGFGAKLARSLLKSTRRTANDDDALSYGGASTASSSDNLKVTGIKAQKKLSMKPQRFSKSMGPMMQYRNSAGSDLEFSSEVLEEYEEEDEDPGELPTFGGQRKSMVRRDNLDAKSLTMGLDLESANFLDWMTQAKCQEWLKSFRSRDPRACIKGFFDDVARDGADSIEEENGFQPELLSPLLSMFQRSSVFSVWRPTSLDSIRKMMKEEGTGKGLDIKGKSAKKGKLSAYVPFLQIHDEEHKKKIRVLPPDERIRVFYKKREMRDNAHSILAGVLDEIKSAVDNALEVLLESDKVDKEDLAQDHTGPCPGMSTGTCPYVQRVLSSFRSINDKGVITDEEQKQIDVLDTWAIDKGHENIAVIDEYSPKCYGLDMPKRLFWEGYVMRAKDIGRPPGSVYDTGRPSRASFQDMNFASIKNEDKIEADVPRAVVWQYTDPYLPPTEPDPDPMMPQTLLMAYEEHGRVMPVVSDFDCFLLGTRGVRFRTPLPADQVELVHNMLGDIENILKDNAEGKSSNWTAMWLNTMKQQKKHVHMPKYGFGDPKSYAIMRHAVQRLAEFGAVRHGAECFNFYFPQELDDEFLVIGGNLGGDKYKYMGLKELQGFLSGCIDLGFTFPLNPKWTLCDEGWGDLWDKLTGSNHPNVQLSINAWYPPGSGLRERIEEIRQANPEGFRSDLSGRKKGTQAWDEAEIALDRYQRIERAKRKLWVVLCWISIVQQSGKKVLQARQEKEGIQVEIKGEEEEVEVKVKGGDASKRVSFQEEPSSEITIESGDLGAKPIPEEIKNMENHNGTSLVGAEPEGKMFSSGSARSEGYMRRSSSLLSKGEEDHMEVIDSVLNTCASNLTDHQRTGLQNIRKYMVDQQNAAQRRIHNRIERRHTTIDGRTTAVMLEDVPSFILKEYGGVKKEELKLSFKAQVKKIMHAQRLISSARNCIEATPRCSESNFLPVEWTSLSMESKRSLMEKLSFANLKLWDYNTIEVAKLCNGSPLLFIGWAILGSPHAQNAMAGDLGVAPIGTCGYSFVTELSLQMPILCSFLRTVEADYLRNPYHNNTHAADVVQTLNTMLQLGGKNYASSPLDIFSILVAAVIHDVKHPGLNNNYQINSRSELAVQYNDVSVLENYSITWLFSKLLGQTRDFTVDIFSGLSNEQFSKARSIIIRSVLETDMTHHFDLLKKMGIHQEMLKGKDAEDWLQTYTNEGVNYDPSMDMLCFLLHQADISNPAKPYPLFVEWADRILAESFAQGDKEISLNLPVSPLCDRVTTDKKQCQIGFIKFVVRPSYRLLGEIIPLFAKTVFPHIEKSLEFWDNYEEGPDLDAIYGNGD